MDDDTFDDSDGENFKLEEKQWSKFQENQHKIGYTEGVTYGQELKLQEGFNLGFRQSVSIFTRLGKMKGVICALQCQKSLSQESKNKLSELLVTTEKLHSKIMSQTILPTPSQREITPSTSREGTEPIVTSVPDFEPDKLHSQLKQKNENEVLPNPSREHATSDLRSPSRTISTDDPNVIEEQLKGSGMGNDDPNVTEAKLKGSEIPDFGGFTLEMNDLVMQINDILTGHQLPHIQDSTSDL